MLWILCALQRVTFVCFCVIIAFVNYIYFYRSKSSKLSHSFEWMDEDKDNKLTRRGIWRYFRSFLCALLTLSGATLDLPMDDATRVCDECAVWTASRLFSSRANNTESSVSFEDIADWYTSGGFQIATWLELLDLSKWLVLSLNDESSTGSQDEEEDQSTSSSASRSSTSKSQDLQLNYLSEDSGADIRTADTSEIFRLRLVGGEELRLSSHDAQFVKEIAIASGLYKYTSSNVVKELYSVSRQGYVSREGFEMFVLTLDLHPNVCYFLSLLVEIYLFKD